jgi:hypothetical protein
MRYLILIMLVAGLAVGFVAGVWFVTGNEAGHVAAIGAPKAGRD